MGHRWDGNEGPSVRGLDASVAMEHQHCVSHSECFP